MASGALQDVSEGLRDVSRRSQVASGGILGYFRNVTGGTSEF